MKYEYKSKAFEGKSVESFCNAWGRKGWEVFSVTPTGIAHNYRITAKRVVGESKISPAISEALILHVEKLLEWVPVCSAGSSGFVRQENLRKVIELAKELK